mmetsp:Transcript_48279/g.114000  ORF Transcript_48279/g.114000 Transcript_48279/m.114000 type:complete len:345 (-) Transcript_48279:66-1100(-)
MPTVEDMLMLPTAPRIESSPCRSDPLVTPLAIFSVNPYPAARALSVSAAPASTTSKACFAWITPFISSTRCSCALSPPLMSALKLCSIWSFSESRTLRTLSTLPLSAVTRLVNVLLTLALSLGRPTVGNESITVLRAWTSRRSCCTASLLTRLTFRMCPCTLGKKAAAHLSQRAEKKEEERTSRRGGTVCFSTSCTAPTYPDWSPTWSISAHFILATGAIAWSSLRRMELRRAVTAASVASSKQSPMPSYCTWGAKAGSMTLTTEIWSCCAVSEVYSQVLMITPTVFSSAAVIAFAPDLFRDTSSTCLWIPSAYRMRVSWKALERWRSVSPVSTASHWVRERLM